MLTSSLCASTIAAVIVVPIPAREGSARARSWMRRLAASIVSRRKCSGGPSGRSRSKDSAAAFEATSPAWAPPMPSATTKIGARTKNESSLALRWRPVSVRNAWSSTRSTRHHRLRASRRLQPELGVADADDVAVEQLGLALERRVVEQGPVGGVHVLDVGPPVAAED